MNNFAYALKKVIVIFLHKHQSGTTFRRLTKIQKLFLL